MIKLKRKRRTTYSLGLAQIVVAAAGRGASDKEIAKVLGVAPETLSRWKQRKPWFGEAVKLARTQKAESELLSSAGQQEQQQQEVHK